MTDAAPELPIACSLDVTSGRDRIAAWRELLASQAVARHRRECEIEVRFAPAAAAELAELVAAERECCGFVDWQVEIDNDAAVLRISGTPQQLTSLGMLSGPD